MPLVQFLPDLVVDRGVTSTSNTLSDGDKNDDNDMEYLLLGRIARLNSHRYTKAKTCPNQYG